MSLSEFKEVADRVGEIKDQMKKLDKELKELEIEKERWEKYIWWIR